MLVVPLTRHRRQHLVLFLSFLSQSCTYRANSFQAGTVIAVGSSGSAGRGSSCPAVGVQPRSFVRRTSLSTQTAMTPPASDAAAETTTTTTTRSTRMEQDSNDDDPYLWLEEVESEAALDFARAANQACLQALGHPEEDPNQTGTYRRILEILESDDRIPHVTHFGTTVASDSSSNGSRENEAILINFWKDAEHPKGLWRCTNLTSYRQSKPVWETILDVDALAKDDGVSWVWGGARPLPRSRDPLHSAQSVTRALISLSRGGSDATHTREFDLTTRQFVQDSPFTLPEAKTRIAYKSRDVVTVGSDFGPDTLTDSGYPRTVREWVRGTNVQDAPVVFEGEKTDVSVSSYVTDERIWGDAIYEVRSRSLTFYTSKYWVRGPLEFEHLLAPDDPQRASLSDPPDFVPLDVQDDAEIGFLGKFLMITLRSDWQPIDGGTVYTKGSVLYTDIDGFLQNGKTACVYRVLFSPTERTAIQYWSATKNYLILVTSDNVKSKLDFFKIQDGDLVKLDGGVSSEPQIRDVSVRPVDPYSGSDEFWFTVNDFVTPSTLYLADASKMETASDQLDAFITEKLKSLPDQYDASNLIVEQRTATSKDGTKVPYFIIMKNTTEFNGRNPTLLYGYGGFEVSLGPHYVATPGVAWLERGGIYVEANIRGGGEFGPAWHQAALKANRNKAYEDFIAVAEHLIKSKICAPKTLAIRGGSNVSIFALNVTSSQGACQLGS